MSKLHSNLGASGAYRWMKCPGSIRLCEGLPDTAGEAAKDGTFAHTLLERCLANGEYDASPYLNSSLEPEAANPGFNGPFYTQEHIDAVNVALDHVFSILKPEDELHVEAKISLSQIRDGMFGTCDVLILKDSGDLHVMDFKYGFGFVDVVGNPQARYYALGALHKMLAAGRKVSSVTMTIIQPRIFGHDPVRSETIEAFELLEWSSELAAAVKATEDPNAPVIAGPWCKFCKAAGSKCDTLRQTATAAALTPVGLIADPKTFDADELGKRLDEAETLAVYLKALAEHAKKAALQQVPTGYKWVAGRSKREWAEGNKPEEIARYAMNVAKLDVTKPLEVQVMTPAQVEKKFGKEKYAEFAKAAVEAKILDVGREAPRLVKATDPKPAIDLKEVRASALGAVEI